MTFLSNAHTHTPYCDGVSSISDMIAAAKSLGFVSLGFSGHAAQGFDRDFSMMNGRQEKYAADLRALQAQQLKDGDAPRLWVGLELDAMADECYRRDAYAYFDYVIGSTHYLCRDYGGACVAVDGDPALLTRYMNETLNGDGLALAKQYFDIHITALLRDKPAIIGHFDLVRKYAARLSLFDENGAAYRKLALSALERAYPCGGVLEVNTGGMARGYLDSPYPTLELVGAWREMGGRVTITSDCHDMRNLTFGFDAAAALVKNAGYTCVERLGTGDLLFETIAL